MCSCRQKDTHRSPSGCIPASVSWYTISSHCIWTELQREEGTMSNQTRVTQFILRGFSDARELRFVVTSFFLFFYLFGLLGNISISTAVFRESCLHSPMYFFLKNLSFLDTCYTSVTIPRLWSFPSWALSTSPILSVWLSSMCSSPCLPLSPFCSQPWHMTYAWPSSNPCSMGPS